MEPRYLCETHFSKNYISNQSRRKMLVHTAVPKPHIDDLESISEPKINLIGSPPTKKTKLNGYNDALTISATRNLKTIQVQRRTNRMTEAKKSIEEPDTETEEETNESHFKIEEVTAANTNQDLTEEVLIEKPKTKKRIQYIVVSSKRPLSTETAAKLVVKSRTKKKEESSMPIEIVDIQEQLNDDAFFEYIEEDPSITSTNVDIAEEKSVVVVEPTDISAQTDISQNKSDSQYSEFIFGGEIFVQMPKRVFEAEKQKLRTEAEMYKNILKKFKKELDQIDY
jgi:hypothetical protein